jgi:hypothetical protein
MGSLYQSGPAATPACAAIKLPKEGRSHAVRPLRPPFTCRQSGPLRRTSPSNEFPPYPVIGQDVRFASTRPLRKRLPNAL